ncbi:uncharacterized protein [Triticum aestivum]|uniref:uncharacterized protein n=1 Tax=Triticum aestivum TaxID=4565 RepID=UPI001D02E5E8|nr:uncharacterized protein LOC123092995 [Triticum aestivum]
METRSLRQARIRLIAMDPSVQSFLERLETTLKEHTAAIHASNSKIDDLVAWRPDLERRVTDLSEAVAVLQRTSLSPPPPEMALHQAPSSSLQSPATAGIHTRAASGTAATLQGPEGHGVYNIQRGPPAVSFQTPPPPPANGQYDAPAPSPPALSPFAHASQLLSGLGQAHPSVQFPQFTGDNPKLWKTLCEQYFTMFAILPSFWVPMATLNFSGSASIWLQSIQKRPAEFDWESFTALLCTRFGRDRHQTLIRQFYTVRQTTTIGDYIEQFESIINHLNLFPHSFCGGTPEGHPSCGVSSKATGPGHCLCPGAAPGRSG